MNLDYEAPVTVARVLDSAKERFDLGRLYSDVKVLNFLTRPEIEMLTICRESLEQPMLWNAWESFKGKPSEFCKSRKEIAYSKSESFLCEYWSDPEIIVRAAQRYREKHRFEEGEYCIADMLR